jgi:hypothetical protein
MPMTTAGGGGGGNTPQITGPAWVTGTKMKSPKIINVPAKRVFFIIMSSFITLAFAHYNRMDWGIFKVAGVKVFRRYVTRSGPLMGLG